MMRLSDDRVTTLVEQSNLPYGSYITTCGDNIYQTNRDTNIVTCFTIKGEKLWEFKDPLVLNGQLCVIFVELMFIISMPLYVDTATVESFTYVTSNGLLSEQDISLSNVPS
jgi:hypothetical protein